MTAPIDSSRCPLCQGENACGAAQGKATCWCFETEIAPVLLERVPAAARDLACVCEACARNLQRTEARTE